VPTPKLQYMVFAISRSGPDAFRQSHSQNCQFSVPARRQSWLRIDGQSDYFTAPEAIPLIMNRSRTIPMTTSGKIAAVDKAAIDHQLMP
jgi:hypothetical protein